MMHLTGEVCGVGCFGSSAFHCARHPGSEEKSRPELHNVTLHRGLQRYSMLTAD